MINKISKKIAVSLKNANVINESEIDLYHYGFFIMLSEFVYVFSCIVLGLIMKMFFQSVIFFAVFLVVRRFTGGFHAKSELHCQIISTLSFLISMILIKVSLLNDLVNLCMILQLVSSIVIIILAPSDTPRKELTVDEKRLFRIISSVIVIVLMVISVILFSGVLSVFVIPVTYALLMDAVLLVLGRLFNYRIKDETN